MYTVDKSIDLHDRSHGWLSISGARQVKRSIYFALIGLGLLFVPFLCFSQNPPEVGVPTPENEKLIDSLVLVTHFEDYFRSYCLSRIKQAAEEKNWSASDMQKITNSINLKNFMWTIHNAFSNYDENQLIALLAKYSSEAEAARFKNAIIDERIVQINLKNFGDNLVDNYCLNSSVEVLPAYPGGDENFYKYLTKSYKYPAAARENNISGTVLIKFVIDKDGSLTDFKVVNHPGYGIAEELIRVLQNCKKWSPGMQDGRPVRVAYTLPYKVSLGQPVKKSAERQPFGGKKEKKKRLFGVQR